MERQSIVQHQDPGIELNNRYGSVSYFIFVITKEDHIKTYIFYFPARLMRAILRQMKRIASAGE